MTTASDSRRAYQRVVLKISGESFAQRGERGISMTEVSLIAAQTMQAANRGVQIAIVIGGGNILRGAQFTAGNASIQEATGHYMGMLATVINGLALQDALESLGGQTRLMTAIRMDGVAEPYIRRRAVRHLEKGRAVIFAAGTGNPYFSTDTAAVLRAIQMKASVIIKATSVDGVYSADPKKDATAKKYDRISYKDVMAGELGVMDQTAITLCKENALPLIVLNIHTPGIVARALRGEPVGTLVS